MVYRGRLPYIPGLEYVDHSYLAVTRDTPTHSKPLMEGLMVAAMSRRRYIYEYSHSPFLVSGCLRPSRYTCSASLVTTALFGRDV